MSSAATSISSVGLATVDNEGNTLAVWFPDPTTTSPDVDLDSLAGVDDILQTESMVVEAAIDPNVAPDSPADAYLRLHLLSHRVYKPHDINVDGIFGALNNVAWTSAGPCAIGELTAARARAAFSGSFLGVNGIDKFPRMTNYVVPSGVRIADANRVRLGAYLGEGTTVMHEGFVNFNAGTLGVSMVEGRISAGVVVGDGSDIGGGASIMGTLSGGGSEVISIGEKCLLGANSGIGISLGDNCTVEAGLYLTGGTVVTMPDGQKSKAKEMSGISNMLFRRNSVSGAVEVLPQSGTWGGLNAALHDN